MAVDAKKFRARVYRTQAPGSQVLGDLDSLRKLDARHETLQFLASRVGWGALVLAVAFFLVMANTNTWENPTLHEGARKGGVLLAVAGVVAFLLRALFSRLNLENRRYELVTRLVRLLQADTAPQERMTVELDFRPATHSDKFAGEGTTRTGWSVKSYVDRWLSLQTRLLDGTQLRVEMFERTGKRSRTRPSRSGKLKTKYRTVSDALVRVRLQVKPEKYQHLERLESRSWDAVKIPLGTRLKSLAVEEARLEMTVLMKGTWGVENEPVQVNAVQVVAMSLLSLYQLLNLSRAIDKKAAHP